MIAERKTWADLAVDAYLRDANGTVWRVVAKDDRDLEPGTSPHYRCRNRAGDWLTISSKPLDTPVTILTPADGEAEIKILRDILGAEVLATKDNRTGEVTCPRWPVGGASGFPLDVFRDHLVLGHGIYATDIKTYAKLVEAHEAAHARDETPHLPHRHP